MISRSNASIKSSALILALILILPACSSPRPYEDIDATNALFAERCKNQAGIKVYKKIPNVEGVFLEKIRPDRAGVELKDPLNPGAAFAHEVGGEEYIISFLGYEHSFRLSSSATENVRGLITPGPQPGAAFNHPGYRFVHVFEDGVLYEYTLQTISTPESKIGPTKVVLRKEKSEKKRARYAVTYEDQVVPAERRLNIASSVVKVVDTQTNEVLGVYVRYARASSFVKIGSQNLYPWLSAQLCGQVLNGDGLRTTRQFVDQVLIPGGR